MEKSYERLFRLNFYIFTLTIKNLVFFQRHKPKYNQKKIFKTKEDFTQRERRHHENNQIFSSFKKVNKKKEKKKLKKYLEGVWNRVSKITKISREKTLPEKGIKS